MPNLSTLINNPFKQFDNLSLLDVELKEQRIINKAVKFNLKRIIKKNEKYNSIQIDRYNNLYLIK